MGKARLALPLVAFISATTHDAIAATYVAPSRSVNQVAYAIGVTRPDLGPQVRKQFATLLIDVARKHNFDPLTGWAIIHHESHWRPNAVGPDGQDIGLAQIRYTASRVCREDRESDRCTARREALMNPAVNIRAMAGAITAWRELCTKVTGRPPDMHNWLAGYGGFSRPAQSILCGRVRVRTSKGWRWQDLRTPKAVLGIVAARKAMIVRLENERVR